MVTPRTVNQLEPRVDEEAKHAIAEYWLDRDPRPRSVPGQRAPKTHRNDGSYRRADFSDIFEGQLRV